MLGNFKKYIEENCLVANRHKVLLAVSGGVDSVVMAHMFRLAKIPFAVAHCNFQLRGNESADDCLFVEKLAKKLNVPFFNEKFNTQEYAVKKGISLQMAARELRYVWFEKVRAANDYDLIAVGSHQSDSLETFLINFTRGTGIAGLHGILPKKGRVIRPLMFAAKEEIEAFAKDNNLDYREDSSNASDKYTRNKIRNQVIPVLKQINPDIEETAKENILRLGDVEKIYRQKIEEARKETVIKAKKGYFLDLEKLKNLEPLNTYLYEFLSPFNFNAADVSDLVGSMEGQPGKRFHSSTHIAFLDRKHLRILPDSAEKDVKNSETTVTQQAEQIRSPLELTFNVMEKKDFRMITGKNTACLDFDKLRFPLKIRKWKKGDYFYPLGMQGKKKLSDYLIDRKTPFYRKDDIFVMESGEDVVWVIGERIDNRYKIGNNTKKVYLASITRQKNEKHQ